jgi:hypothetical protein
MGSPGKYFNAFTRSYLGWQSTGFADAADAINAAGALASWLGELPDAAADIQQLALGAAYTASIANRPEAAVEFTTVGRDASLIRPVASDEDIASAALLAYLDASAHFSLGQRIRDTSLLVESSSLADRLSPRSAFRSYLALHRHTLMGRLAAASLERTSAVAHLRRAIDVGDPLLRNRRLFRQLADSWMSIVWGDVSKFMPDADEKAAETLRIDVERTYWRAAVALGAAAGEQSVDEARVALEACKEFGFIEGPTFLLRPAILGLSADERRQMLSDLEAVAVENDLGPTWQLLLHSSNAAALLREGDDAAANDAIRNAVRYLPECEDGPTQTLALADMGRISMAEREEALDLADRFLTPFTLGVSVLQDSPYRLQYKALFDEHFATGVRAAADQYRDNISKEASRALSVLLDAVRSPAAESLPAEQAPGSVDEGLAEAADRIGRLRVALDGRPGLGVLMSQTTGEDTLFVCASAENEIRIAYARPGYREACLALAEAQADLISGKGSDVDVLRAFGAEAFAALPDEAQQTIVDCEDLIIVPDLAAEAAGVPYELFHDGDSYLGVNKSIARAQSLSRLVQILEPPVLPAQHSTRTVSVAVPSVAGLEELVFAEAEAADARTFFVDGGWEAPEVDVEHLTGAVILDALELADFVHVAAHGEVGAGRQAVVLPRGNRLSVDDIEDSHRLLRSVVFLNTCALGQSEFLGAGVSRGVANALGTAGAPCVIANLLPIQDLGAARLAREFYSFVGEHTVGRALAKARAAAADRGVLPSIWGGMVLVGDPTWRIDSDAPASASDEVTALLSTNVDADADGKQRERTYLEALALLKAKPYHPRLTAALCWIKSAAELTPGDIDPDQIDALARLAAALNHPTGEALVRWSAAQASPDHESLQLAADALMKVAPYSGLWRRAHTSVLAELNRLDTPAEPQAVGSQISVNDMSDPAVAALWDRIRAGDQDEIRRIGVATLRRPDTDIDTAAWNSVVLGRHGRFDGPYSSIGFAAQLTEKLVALEMLPDSARLHAKRILAGLLPYLWTTQRRHHLDPIRAEEQAAALRIALESIATHWVTTESYEDYAVVSSVEAELQHYLGDGSKGAAESLHATLQEAIDQLKKTWKDSAADGAAWLLGLLDEARYDVARANGAQRAKEPLIAALHAEINADADSWFYYYVSNGRQAVPSQPFVFLDQWRAQSNAMFEDA